MSSHILDTVKENHRELESFYSALTHCGDPEEQTAFQNKLTWALARHLVAEELVIYPAIERYVREGMEVTDEERREHQAIKERLKNFQDMPSTDPQFLPTTHSLMAELHANDLQETTKDLVNLESAITRDESRRLSKWFNRTKMFVPTRAHPGMSDRPPFETAAALMMAPVDQLADIFGSGLRTRSTRLSFLRWTRTR